MKRIPLSRIGFARRQDGAVLAVEFALVSALFLLTLLVGIVEFGRGLFYMNASAQATRLGARMAVVCDSSSAQQLLIKQRMHDYVSVLPAGNIDILYSADGGFVTVRIRPESTRFETLIPFVPVSWTLPPFSTTLPRESMSSEGGTNPVCEPPWAQPLWIPL